MNKAELIAAMAEKAELSKKDSGETKEQTNNLPMIIGGVVMVVLIAVAGGIYYVKKVKK